MRVEDSAFWITAGLMALAILYPASMSIYIAFTEAGNFSLGGFRRILAHPSVGREVVTTIVFAAGATLGAAAIGVPLAWINARTDVPGRRFLEILCVVPLFISAFVGAMAWRLLLVPRAGMVSRTLTDWGYPPEWLPNVYSLTSMIIIQSIFYSPFMYLYAVASLRQMDPSLEEVARIHGAKPLQTLWRITLSVNGPALLSGMVLVFVFTVGTLEIPLALGIPGGNYVLATRIWTLMSDYPQDVTMAAALGIVAILIAAAGIWVQRRILGERQFTTVTGKGFRAKRVSLGRRRWLAFGIVVAYVLIAVIAPLVVLVLVGLQKFWAGAFDPDLFTLDNFRSVMFEYDVTRRAIVNTMISCTVAATIAVALATILSQTRSRLGEALMGLLVLLPIAIPGAIFGMMVLFAFVRTPIYNTLNIIIFAYVIGYFYLAYRSIYSVRLSIPWRTGAVRSDPRSILVEIIRPDPAAAAEAGDLFRLADDVCRSGTGVFLRDVPVPQRHRSHVRGVLPADGATFRQTCRLHGDPDGNPAAGDDHLPAYQLPAFRHDHRVEPQLRSAPGYAAPSGIRNRSVSMIASTVISTSAPGGPSPVTSISVTGRPIVPEILEALIRSRVVLLEVKHVRRGCHDIVERRTHILKTNPDVLTGLPDLRPHVLSGDLAAGHTGRLSRQVDMRVGFVADDDDRRIQQYAVLDACPHVFRTQEVSLEHVQSSPLMSLSFFVAACHRTTHLDAVVSRKPRQSCCV